VLSNSRLYFLVSLVGFYIDPLATHPTHCPRTNTNNYFSPFQQLKVYKESMDMKQAPVVLVGRDTFAALVPEVMPPPMACCLR
jgi:hypothetical protein